MRDRSISWPGHRVLKPPPPGTLPPIVILPNDFEIVWSKYAAVAGMRFQSDRRGRTDDRGMSATSAPVSITVVPTMIVTNAGAW